MIPKTASNRRVIISYLEQCSEDELIDDVVIPMLNCNGYSLIRKVTHGPGEHGKDIVFSKFNTAFLDMEYVVVQAKAIAVSPGNVVDFANQLIRALRTPITGLNGANEVFPNYVVFFNSKRISNDANFEFPYLIDGKNNIKLIHQDLAYELMANNSIIPDIIQRQLTIEDVHHDRQEQQILNILSNNKTNEIDSLFNLILPTYHNLSDTIKAVIIEYIFNTWNEDKSWDGTVRPMKWLLKYFSFIQPSQYPKLKEICSEYFNEYHSYEARANTVEVFKKITSDMIEEFKSDFVIAVASQISHQKDDRIAFDKMNGIDENGLSERASALFQHVKNYISVYFERGIGHEEKSIQLNQKRRELRQIFWGPEDD